MPPAPPPQRRAVFRPATTLMLLYFAAFFLAFALLLILPGMLEGLEGLPRTLSEEQAKQAGTELARELAAPRLLPAFFLALVTVVLGVRLQVLPGLRDPNRPR